MKIDEMLEKYCKNGVRFYKLDDIVCGECLDEVIEALVTEDQAQRLAEID